MSDQIQTYDPGIFNVPNVVEAKKIILTPEGNPTQWRWQHETPYLVECIRRHGSLPGADLPWYVLDYGCGIGRIAKELIDQFSATVTGVDTSAEMRALAVTYVGKGAPFEVRSTIDFLPKNHYNTAVAIWALQHVLEPAGEIEAIHNTLRPGGRFIVVNQFTRAVPVVPTASYPLRFFDDGHDIAALVRARFGANHCVTHPLQAQSVGEMIAQNAYILVAEK